MGWKSTAVFALLFDHQTWKFGLFVVSLDTTFFEYAQKSTEPVKKSISSTDPFLFGSVENDSFRAPWSMSAPRILVSWIFGPSSPVKNRISNTEIAFIASRKALPTRFEPLLKSLQSELDWEIQWFENALLTSSENKFNGTQILLKASGPLWQWF